MKFLRQLLVAPAALGLLAPVAANATDFNATELNINGVSDYAATGEQVTSITQFSDVYPTDWAYQALSNLIERYGCVAGYPNGTYRGNRAMTRFEAAALLNACLDRVTEVTDELKRLMKEFEKELAILKGRVDGLEARVGELEATQFSTTTKLKGQATFVIGANSFGGDAKQGNRFFTLQKESNGQFDIFGFGDRRSTVASELSGATSFNYDLQLSFDTSFTGKDLFRTMLRAGNFAESAFGGDGYVGLDALEISFEEPSGADSLGVNRIFYQFPVGAGFTATVGGVVRQDDMLAVWPSAYPSDTILDVFSYAGAPATYNTALGAGAGLWWESNDFSISANYISPNGSSSKPSPSGVVDELGTEDCSESGGIATNCAGSNGTVQIAYAPENWGIAAAYNYTSKNAGALYAGNATPLADIFSNFGNNSSFGLSAWWSPEEAGWFPSISAGWGYNSITNGNDTFYLRSATTQSWYVGLQWADAFLKGNTLGMAVGQPTFVTNVSFRNFVNQSDFIADGNYAWEWWYQFQVTDNISVTPAIYYLSRPWGASTNTITNASNGTFDNFGGLLKTTFRF